MYRKMWMSLLFTVSMIAAGEISAQIPDKENLIKNGNFDSEKALTATKKGIRYQIGKNWQTMALIWSKDTKLRNKIFPLMLVSVEKNSAEQKNVIVIEHKADIIQHLDKTGKPMLATYCRQNVSWSGADKPAECMFKMKVKGNHGKLSISRSVMLICNFKDGTGKKAKNTGRTLLRRFSVAPGKWQDVNTKVIIPPGTRNCEISICLYGVGKFAFDDIRLEKVK